MLDSSVLAGSPSKPPSESSALTMCFDAIDTLVALDAWLLWKVLSHRSMTVAAPFRGGTITVRDLLFEPSEIKRLEH